MSKENRTRSDHSFWGFPVEWGMPPGTPMSAERAAWVRENVQKRMAWSGEAALNWLHRRQYDRAYRRASGDSSAL
jgi:hypothetical protein